MNIEILHIAECPNWQAVKPLLESALGQDHVTKPEIVFRLVTSQSEAELLDFPGSPTILIDSRDLFPSTGYPGGLACRIYPTPAGLAGLPTLAQIKAALDSMRKGADPECDCCGRSMPRAKLHAVGDPPSYICRRCGLWIALRWRRDTT